MGEEFERERQEYFDRISGVGEWQGQKFKTSRWAWNIAYHPAMLGRGRGKMRRSPWDPFKPLIFLAVVIGIPAAIVFLSGTDMSLGVQIAIVFGSAVMIVSLMAFASMSAARRAQRAPKPFPHPGPKGKHRHR